MFGESFLPFARRQDKAQERKKAYLAVVLLAAPLSAQVGAEPYTADPQQFPGQLARMRLEMLYPKPGAELPHRVSADAAGRLAAILAESDAAV